VTKRTGFYPRPTVDGRGRAVVSHAGAEVVRALLPQLGGNDELDALVQALHICGLTPLGWPPRHRLAKERQIVIGGCCTSR